MGPALTLVTPPADTPVDPAFVKERVPDAAGVDDDVLQAFIDAATQRLDGWDGILGGKALVAQSWRMDLAAWPSCDWQRVKLPLSPVQSITHVKFYDGSNALQTVDAGSYLLSIPTQTIWLASGVAWPSLYDRHDAAQITFVAGYGDPDDVPMPLRMAIALLAVSFWRSAGRDAALKDEAIPGVISRSWDVSAERTISGAVDALIFPYRVPAL